MVRVYSLETSTYEYAARRGKIRTNVHIINANQMTQRYT